MNQTHMNTNEATTTDSTMNTNQPTNDESKAREIAEALKAESHAAANPYDVVKGLGLSEADQWRLIAQIGQGLMSNTHARRPMARLVTLAGQECDKDSRLEREISKQAATNLPLAEYRAARVRRRLRRRADDYTRALAEVSLCHEKRGAEEAYLLIEHLNDAADHVPRNWICDDGTRLVPFREEIRDGLVQAEKVARTGQWQEMLRSVPSGTLRSWLRDLAALNGDHDSKLEAKIAARVQGCVSNPTEKDASVWGEALQDAELDREDHFVNGATAHELRAGYVAV